MTTAVKPPTTRATTYWRKDGTDHVRGDYRIRRVEVTRTYAMRGHDGTPTYSWPIEHKGAPIGVAARLRDAKTIADDHKRGG
jgi:hypothetical protein